jgi:hypothetical protein
MTLNTFHAFMHYLLFAWNYKNHDTDFKEGLIFHNYYLYYKIELFFIKLLCYIIIWIIYLI